MTSDSVHFAGGVYEAIPGRLAVGPMVHVKLLVQKPAGTLFGPMKLPDPSSRYFVSCLSVSGSSATSPSTSLTASTRPAEGNHRDPAAPAPAAVAPSPPPSPTPAPKVGPSRPNNSVADFLAKMKERQAHLRRPVAGADGGLTSPPMLPSPAGAAEAIDPRAAGAPDGVSTAAQASANAALSKLIIETLGAEHFHQCTMPTDKLQTPETDSAITFVRKALHEDANAIVYVFSDSGKNRASALAMLYLLQGEQVSLREATKRLSLSTPRVAYMMELLGLEKERAASKGLPSDFDDHAWFTRYFSIRYPDRGMRAVRAAVESSRGDYARTDRILQEEVFFARSVAETNQRKEKLKMALAADAAAERNEFNSQTFGTLDDREQSRLSFFNSSFTPPVEVTPAESHELATSSSALSCRRGQRDMENSLSTRQAPAILGMPSLGGFHAARSTAADAPAEAQSTLSGSSGSTVPLPATALTAVDEDMLRTIVRGLRTCDVAASPEEVRDSYLRHRRNKAKVLADFLKGSSDTAKMTKIMRGLPTTVASRTPRSSTAASSAQGGEGQDAAVRQSPDRPIARGGVRATEPPQRSGAAAREEPSPEPERPDMGDTSRTPSDVDEVDETITSTTERVMLNAFAFPPPSPR